MVKAQKAPILQVTIEHKLDSDTLIRNNANLVETLRSSEVWREIIFPLIEEGIRSVDGAVINGRFQFGEISRTTKSKEYLTGYKDGLAELLNRIDDFKLAKDNLIKQRKREAEELDAAKTGRVINPFMEDDV